MGARSSDGTERSAHDDGWRAAVARARQRGPKALVPLLQVAVAATLAWLIALSIGATPIRSSRRSRSSSR